MTLVATPLATRRYRSLCRFPLKRQVETLRLGCRSVSFVQVELVKGSAVAACRFLFVC